MADIPRIALTAGEPAGIGPDLCLYLALQDHPVDLVTIADPRVLAARARERNLDLKILETDTTARRRMHRAGELRVLPVAARVPVSAGRVDPGNARSVLESLDIAVKGCLENRFNALVTGPVHKGAINDAGISFTGHTEYLRDRSGTAHVVMLLATEHLRVALATTHLPLADVSASLNRHDLETTLRVLHHDLQRLFGVDKPHVLVCGLNPHAGENGHLGREEIEIIEPALETVRAEGLNVSGPLPADTLFTPGHLDGAHAVLAMYHDQGLPVLKYAGFGQAVNITLGLPFIRTSVDHGTALALAGHGEIDTGSMRTALAYAIRMAAIAGRRVA